MNGIYISGMVLPKSCTECGCEQEGFWCGVLEGYTDTKYFDNKRHPNCPLVPVPPHGRLIDADALMQEFEKAQRMMEQHGHEYTCSFMSSGQEISTEWYCVEDMVENAPTIIEAEGGDAQ